jgi:hypothetical protein
VKAQPSARVGSVGLRQPNATTTHSTARVRAKKKIAEGPSHPIGQPSLRQVVWAVVEHVAPLAQALEVGRRAVRRVVVEMGCGENDAGSAEPVEVGAPGWNAPVSMIVAPAGVVTIEPSPRQGGKAPLSYGDVCKPRSSPLPDRIGSPGSVGASRWGRTSEATRESA